MKLFPAIDLRDGNVVRLLRGDYAASTTYASDPLRVAQSFVDDGAEYLHTVDLDGARTGSQHNVDVVLSIANALPLRVQMGGGIRTAETARRLLEGGVWRVVFGTVATTQPEVVDEVAQAYPGRVAVGLDARGTQVAVQGWEHESGKTIRDMVKRFAESHVALIVTEISRDGTLGGPDLDGLRAVLDATEENTEVIASGGVGSCDDLRSIRALRGANGRSLGGVIAGKAIYEERFTVAEALDALGEGNS